MASKRVGDLHHQLFLAYKSCHPSLSGSDCQINSNEIWKKAQFDFPNKDERYGHISKVIGEFKIKATKQKVRSLSYFVQLPSKQSNHRNEVASTKPFSSKTEDSNVSLQDNKSCDKLVLEQLTSKRKAISCEDNDDNDVQTKHVTKKPAQDFLQKKITFLETKLNAAVEARDTGLAGDKIDAEIKNFRVELKKAKQNLAAKIKGAERSKQFRAKEKHKKVELSKNNPSVPAPRERPGQPAIAELQSSLRDTIINIAIHGSAADERRRTEMMRSCRTLPELHEELLSMGLQLSKSATYLHLLPRSSNTREGKRHVRAVPVKLSKPQATLHKTHIDGEFCTSTIRNLESVASLLGPKQVFVLSQDDKARVPLGLPAVKAHVPLLMHLEYRLKLPDHDFVVAEQHKLLPSVYATVEVAESGFGRTEAVGYSGPTYIAIRSGKHTSSTANSHAFDFDRLLQIPAFDAYTKTSTNAMKPVVMIFADGGPDENPRYTKVKLFAIKHFKEHNLDALFVATNAPGRSAYNRVERRMAPLSKQLSGVILNHEHFGSHLNSSCQTIDEDLEKRNFQHAGETLAKIWSETVIDKFEVFAEYRSAEHSFETPQKVDSEWYEKHVQESQYLFQVVKCTDATCCSPQRSALRDVLPDGFLPPPCPLLQTPSKLVIPSLQDKESCKFAPLLVRLAAKVAPDLGNLKTMPYDLFCPSVHQEIEKKTCKTCGRYFTSQASTMEHERRVHSKAVAAVFAQPIKVRPQRIAARRANELMCLIRNQEATSEDVEWIDENNVDLTDVTVPDSVCPSRNLPVKSETEWLRTPWVIDDGH